MKTIFLGLAFSLTTSALLAQNVLNGGLEADVSVLAPCNGLEAYKFRAAMKNLAWPKAWLSKGAGGIFNVYLSKDCPVHNFQGAPKQGDHYLALNSWVKVGDSTTYGGDGIILKLDADLQSFHTYEVKFYQKKFPTRASVELQFGYTNDTADLGVICDSTSAPTDTQWHMRTVKITPVGNAKYISIRATKGILLSSNPADNSFTGIDDITITHFAGIHDNNPAQHKVYPNPVIDKVVVEGLIKGTLMQLTDITGRLIVERTSSQQREVIKIEDLRPGVYLLRLTDDNETTTKTIIKQ